jgi:hypothetical protein
LGNAIAASRPEFELRNSSAMCRTITIRVRVGTTGMSAHTQATSGSRQRGQRRSSASTAAVYRAIRRPVQQG